MTSNIIIAIPDCVVAIYDRNSPVNAEGVAQELLAAAQEKATHPVMLAPAWRTILRPFVKAGTIGIWLTFFHGVFKLTAVLHETMAEGIDAVNADFIEKC